MWNSADNDGISGPTNHSIEPSLIQETSQQPLSTCRHPSGKFRFSFRQKKRKDQQSDHTREVADNIKDLNLEANALVANLMPKLISQSEAIAIDEELCSEYSFTVEQIVELSGYACAAAIARLYPKEGNNDCAILVCCGPGNNGGDGLVCARHLKNFGYRPTVFYPKVPAKPLYKTLLSQCEKMDMPFLSYMPGEARLLDSAYTFVVDALFGFRFKPPVREDLASAVQRLREIKIPIVSIDIPSGWDVDRGPSPNDLMPETLISLTAPKMCTAYFRGRNHYLGGRFVPSSLAVKYNLNLPQFPGSEPCVALDHTLSPNS